MSSFVDRCRGDYYLTIKPSNLKLKVEKPINILELCQSAQVFIPNHCGGKGRCGKCVVIVEDSKGISPVSDTERRLLGKDIEHGRRLACQAILSGDTVITIKEEETSQFETPKLLTQGFKRASAISVIHLYCSEEQVKEVSSKEELLNRLINSSSKKFKLNWNLEALRSLPNLSDIVRTNLSVVLDECGNLIEVRSGTLKRLYGIAIDIGTTTVAGYLYELLKGQYIASYADLNPQRKYGVDVISRISYSLNNHNGSQILRSEIIGCINHIIEELCKRGSIEQGSVYMLSVVGNTVMHHILLGLPLVDLAMAPYRAVTTKAMRIPAKGLGIDISEGGQVFLLPLKAAYLGSDAVAAVLCSGLHKKKPLTLLVDLGTNAEIVLGNRDQLLSTSAAASPAFEAAHVRCGMPSFPGAIEKIRIKKGEGLIRFWTIGNAPPKGICGSGIVSALAEFLRHGFISTAGRFTNKVPKGLLRESTEGLEIVIAQDSSHTSKEIVITEVDISQLQLAKAAISAGIKVLLKEFRGKEIEEVIITGAFGTSLEARDLKEIGLIPQGIGGKIKIMENAAGKGACMALLDIRKRKEAIEIANRLQYVDLSQDPDFYELFVGGLVLGNV